jgi:NAD(P)-dependent dehydrogenase (short-subunit alcohol dehydrogenase family)
MQGRTVVITGGTAGIGLVAAELLATAGARVVLVGRDRRHGEAALARVPGAALHYADLALMGEVRRLAATLAELPRIDVLVLNAGAIFAWREVTREGLERTFALNHMHGFLLANLLLGKLKESAPARILFVASEAHRGAYLDLDDLQSVRRYSAWPVYRRSKLCNILVTRELARRAEGSGITVNAVHPGFVASGFGDRNPFPFRAALGLAKRFMAIDVEAGARPLVDLAGAPSLATTTGRYFDKGVERRPSPEAEDSRTARALWEASERIAGL